jgi:Putative zinc-finger
MSDEPKAAAILQRLLEGTRDEELDCDRFLELLPPYLDGRIGSEELREHIAHHAGQCPECNEELDILKRALGPDES